MKAPTIVTTLMMATLLFTQSAVASDRLTAQDAVPTSQQSATQDPDISAESYLELVQRIKQDSLRVLASKLETTQFIKELIHNTLRDFVDTSRRGKPQL